MHNENTSPGTSTYRNDPGIVERNSSLRSLDLFAIALISTVAAVGGFVVFALILGR